MSRRRVYCLALAVAMTMFGLGAVTVPAAGAQLQGMVAQSLPEVTVTGCGVQNIPPVAEAPLTAGNPTNITLNADGSLLYVTQAPTAGTDGNGEISVRDAQTLVEKAAIPVPYPFAAKVALNPVGTKGYLPTNANTVQVFDTSTNTITAAIPVDPQPTKVKFSRDGSQAYVLHYGSSGITVLDTKTDSIMATWNNYYLKYGTFDDFELDPTGTYAYVAANQKYAVLVLDLKSGAVIDEIPVGGPVSHVALTRDGHTLYVMDRFNQRTFVLDMATKSIKNTFPVTGETVILSDSENRAFIPRSTSNNVAVVDLITNALICSHWLLPLQAEDPVDITLDPGSHRLYVADSGMVTSKVLVLALPDERNPAFGDVPQGSLYYREISWAATAGITTGYDDQTFRPLEPINRDAMAAFLYRFHGSPEFTPPVTSPFTDVSPSDKFYKEITWLARMGITRGWPDGTYRPLEPVNRDAMAAFLYRTVDHARFIPPTTSPFTDVQTSDPFYVEITFLSATGVATGWPDGTFKPLVPVNRDAMGAFLFRLNPMATSLLR